MLLSIFAQIVHIIMNDNPEIFFCIVFSNLLPIECLLWWRWCHKL